MVFGSDLFNIVKFGKSIRGYQPILPLIVVLIFFTILFYNINLNSKLWSIFAYLFFIEYLILLNIKNYLKKLKDIFYTIILINLGNIAYVIGNLMAIIGISKLLNRKIYLKSRQNK